MGGMLAARTKKRCTPDRLSLPQIYMRQRWYDPQLQRFISRDPIGLRGGANLYQYCNNNPTLFVDPSGLQGSGAAIGLGILAGNLGISGAAIDTAIATGGVIAIPAVITAGTLNAAIRDGMRPVPGTSRGPYFGDTMGEDRWGGRRYEAQSEQYEGWAPSDEQRKSGTNQGGASSRNETGPHDWNKRPPDEGKGRPKSGRPPLDCFTRYMRCLAKVIERYPGDPAAIKVQSDLCGLTKNNCDDASCKGQGKYFILSDSWPGD